MANILALSCDHTLSVLVAWMLFKNQVDLAMFSYIVMDERKN
jgi:hypothetical protein